METGIVQPQAFSGEHPTPRHAVEYVVEVWTAFLGHRWTTLVIWHLSAGPKRFGTLRALLAGVTQKVLSERLVTLEERGIIEREQPARFPRTVTYQLTPHGRALVTVLDQLDRWAQPPATRT